MTSAYLNLDEATSLFDEIVNNFYRFLSTTDLHYGILIVAIFYTVTYFVLPRYERDLRRQSSGGRREANHVTVGILLFIILQALHETNPHMILGEMTPLTVVRPIPFLVALLVIVDFGQKTMRDHPNSLPKFNVLRLFKHGAIANSTSFLLVLALILTISGFEVLKLPTLENSSKVPEDELSSSIHMLDLVRFSVVLFFSLVLSNYLLSFVIKTPEDRNTSSFNESAVNVFFFANFIACIAISLIILGVELVRVGIFSVVVGGGLAVAFRDLFNNIISGLILKWDDSLKEDQTIEWMPGRTGTVRDINLRYTLLGDRNNQEIIIPNGILLSAPIINFSKSEREVRITGVKLPVSHDTDLNKLTTLIEKEVLSVKRVINVPTYPPKVFVVEHTSNATILEIRFWIDGPEDGIANIKSDVLKKCTELVRTTTITKLPVQRHEITIENAP